jgi:hypothetical protein
MSTLQNVATQHSVFPSSHPDLNPKGLIYVSLKSYVATKDVTFKFDDAILVHEKLNSITKDE